MFKKNLKCRCEIGNNVIGQINKMKSVLPIMLAIAQMLPKQTYGNKICEKRPKNSREIFRRKQDSILNFSNHYAIGCPKEQGRKDGLVNIFKINPTRNKSCSFSVRL